MPSRLDRLLAAYVAGEVHPLCADERARLDDAGLGATGVRRVRDLALLPPIDADQVDGLSSVLRPSAGNLDRTGMRWQWLWSRLLLRRARFVEEVVEPRYRTVQFDDHDGLLVASTDADLDRLAELGRRWLERAGVRRGDVLMSLLPAHPEVAFWQLTLGARRGGVPALHVGPSVAAEDVAWFSPSVLAGTPDELARVAEEAAEVGADLRSLRLVLVLGEPLASDGRSWLADAYGGATVLSAWAPPGVRALWGECHGGALHTSVDAEVVEILDDLDRPAAPGRAGTVVWTPVGWRGTVVLRLRTAVRARLVTGRCPACGDVSPRLAPPNATVRAGDERRAASARLPQIDPDPEPVPDDGGQLEALLARVLDQEPLVAAWQAERAWNGSGEAVSVHLAPVPGARAALEAALPELGYVLEVDRIVVERPSLLAERLRISRGRRVIEL